MQMTSKKFKKECNKYCHRALNFYCFDDDDSYDLNCLVDDAIQSGQTPKQFINEHFHDDIAELEYYHYLQEESYNHMMEQDIYFDDET